METSSSTMNPPTRQTASAFHRRGSGCSVVAAEACSTCCEGASVTADLSCALAPGRTAGGASAAGRGGPTHGASCTTEMRRPLSAAQENVGQLQCRAVPPQSPQVTDDDRDVTGERPLPHPDDRGPGPPSRRDPRAAVLEDDARGRWHPEGLGGRQVAG